MPYLKKMEPDVRCPLEYGISILGGKWRSRVICLLSGLGPLHYSQIKTEMLNITDGVLSGILKNLIEEEILTKKSAPDSSGRNLFTYELTDKGKSLVPLLKEICKWSGRFYKENKNVTMVHCQKCVHYQHWERSKKISI